jgi:hypothetical protein
MRDSIKEINQWWDENHEIITPADEEPLHENHEDGKVTELERTLMQSRYNYLSLIFHFTSMKIWIKIKGRL